MSYRLIGPLYLDKYDGSRFARDRCMLLLRSPDDTAAAQQALPAQILLEKTLDGARDIVCAMTFRIGQMPSG